MSTLLLASLLAPLFAVPQGSDVDSSAPTPSGAWRAEAAQVDPSTDQAVWRLLDDEVEALSASAQTFGDPRVSGWIRANYAQAAENMPGGAGTEYGGFALDSVRVGIEGEREAFAYEVSIEAFSGTWVLLDAKASVPVTDDITATVGQFRTPFLRSGLVNENRLLFILRTRNGFFASARNVRQQGVMFSGSYENFDAYVAAQNGVDGVTDNLLTTFRVVWNAVGGGTPMHEGAYGSGDGTRVSVGIAISDDESGDNGGSTAIEASAQHGPFSLSVETVSYDSDYSTVDMIDDPTLPADLRRGDTDPWSATASWMAVPDKWEVAARIDEWDTVSDKSTTHIGVNRYLDGHDVKVQINFRMDDAVLPEEDWIAVGLTGGF